MRTLFRGLGLLACLALAGPLSAQDYPTRVVNFVVPAAAGGPSDVIARLVAEQLQRSLGQPVVVVNRPGGSLTIGTASVANADPDGHTLLFTTSTPIVMVPFTMRNVPYDVQRDLITVAHVGTTPLVLYVNAQLPIRNIGELVAYARANEREANYGSYGTGSSAHVLMEVLNAQTRVPMQHVPYRGVAPELQDLAGRQILTGIADIGTAAPLVTGNLIRPIAVTGTQRASALPDVGTFAEQGITGLDTFSPWWGVFAPARTPRPIVDRLSREIAQIVAQPEFRARLASFGIDPSGLLSEQAHALTVREMASWQQTIRGLSHLTFEE